MPDGRVIKLAKVEGWLNDWRRRLSEHSVASAKRAALRTFLILEKVGESWNTKWGPLETSLAAVAFERGLAISAGARWPELLVALLLPEENRQRRSVLSRALAKVAFEGWSAEEVVSLGLEKAATSKSRPKGALLHGAHPLTGQCLAALRSGAPCRVDHSAGGSRASIRR